MIYHVLPGDAAANDFRNTGFTGELIVCRECLIVGPVDAENPDEFWDQRGRFILSEYGEDEIEFQERVADELERLCEVEAGDEVNLWFEYELFCSTNMWFCISLIADSGAVVYRVEPAVRSKDDIWKGFGSLSPADLRKCFDRRTKFEQRDLDLGFSLWRAYRTGDHTRIDELAEVQSSCFPYLADVCDAEIAKSTRPMEVLNEILAEGVTDFNEIFAEFSRRAGVYGFGDLQVQRLLDHI